MRNYLLLLLVLSVLISCTTSKTYYETGELKAKGNVVHHLKNGSWNYYYKNGTLYQTGSFKNDKEHGLWKIYHENEMLWQTGAFKEGKQDGEWQFFHDNGNKEGIGSLSSGKMIGKWLWYHTNGALYTERHYEDGKLMEVISCFDGNGTALPKGTLKNGNGTLNSYDITGNLTDVLTYENGEFKK